MSYFTNFPLVPYYFGNEKSFNYIENLSSYVDLLDQVVDDASFYEYYTIIDGDRPDTLSHKLYNSTEYHWTFFLLNGSLRERGWPLTLQQVEERAKIFYPNYAIQMAGEHKTGKNVNSLVTSIEPLSKRVSTGTDVIINASATTAEIVKINLDIGQIVLKHKSGPTNNMTNITKILFNNGMDPANPGFIMYLYDTTVGSVFYNNVVEYNAPHHYENDGVWVDIDAYDLTAGVSGATPVTNLEYFQNENDSGKKIRVLRPNMIRKISQEFSSLLRI